MSCRRHDWTGQARAAQERERGAEDRAAILERAAREKAALLDGQLADRYAELKRRLAQEHDADREAYTAAKGEFVAAALRRRIP